MLFAYYGVKVIPILGIKVTKPYFSDDKKKLFSRIIKINSELNTILRKKEILVRFFEEVCLNTNDTYNYENINLSYCEDYTMKQWKELHQYFLDKIPAIKKSLIELQTDFQSFHDKYYQYWYKIE